MNPIFYSTFVGPIDDKEWVFFGFITVCLFAAGLIAIAIDFIQSRKAK